MSTGIKVAIGAGVVVGGILLFGLYAVIRRFANHPHNPNQDFENFHASTYPPRTGPYSQFTGHIPPTDSTTPATGQNSLPPRQHPSPPVAQATVAAATARKPMKAKPETGGTLKETRELSGDAPPNRVEMSGKSAVIHKELQGESILRRQEPAHRTVPIQPELAANSKSTTAYRTELPALVHGTDSQATIHRTELPAKAHRREVPAKVQVVELGGVEPGRRLELDGFPIVHPASELDASPYNRMSPGASQFSTLPEVVEVTTPSSGNRSFSNVAIQQEINWLDQEIAEQERLQALKDQRARLAAQLRANKG